MFLLCCSVAKSCPTLCNPVDYSMPGSSVLYLLEFAQIHVHWVSDSKDLILYCSFCLQSFPVSGSLPVSQLFASGGQSVEASALASFLPMNFESWFPLGLTGLISLLSKGLWRSLQHCPRSILDIIQPGGLIFQHHIFLLFHTVHEVLQAGILEWVAVSSSSGAHFVRTLHCDLSVLGNPAQHGL